METRLFEEEPIITSEKRLNQDLDFFDLRIVLKYLRCQMT